MDDVFVDLQRIGALHERARAEADLVLAGCRVVVVLQRLQAHGLEHGGHLGAQIGHVVDRRHGERGAPLRPVAAVADVVAGARVVGSFLGIDPKEGLVGHDPEADVVEHAELGLGGDQRAVRDAGRAQALLGALGERARAALVAEPGAGLDDVAQEDQARLGAERVEHGARQVGLEHHVGFADVAPAGDRRAVEHHALVQMRLGDAARGEAEMLPPAAQVGEAEVDGLDAVAADLLEDGLRVRHPGYPWSIERPCLRHWTAGASAEPSRRTWRASCYRGPAPPAITSGSRPWHRSASKTFARPSTRRRRRPACARRSRRCGTTPRATGTPRIASPSREDNADGAWVHAYLHRVEGDLANAGYWYRRAGKPASQQPLRDEWTAIVKALLAD